MQIRARRPKFNCLRYKYPTYFHGINKSRIPNLGTVKTILMYQFSRMSIEIKMLCRVRDRPAFLAITSSSFPFSWSCRSRNLPAKLAATRLWWSCCSTYFLQLLLRQRNLSLLSYDTIRYASNFSIDLYESLESRDGPHGEALFRGSSVRFGSWWRLVLRCSP